MIRLQCVCYTKLIKTAHGSERLARAIHLKYANVLKIKLRTKKTSVKLIRFNLTKYYFRLITQRLLSDDYRVETVPSISFGNIKE